MKNKLRPRASSLLLSLLTLSTLVYSANVQALISELFLPREGIRKPEYKVSVERNVALITSDGVALVSDIFYPKTDEKTPTILVRIPFTKTFMNKLRADAVARFWASRGYTVVIQGSRGRYKSGGKYYPLSHERRDGIETLAWLAKQPWFDGRLGMWGGSAFGYTQWVLADQLNPGPSALMIQISSTNFYGMFYPGGAFSLESALFWAVRSHGEKDKDPSLGDLERGYDGFPLIHADDRAIGDIPFFNDWVNHATRDEYWADIDGQDRARTIQAPVLLMAGWYDPFLPTQISDFIRIRREAISHAAKSSRIIIGPWVHADTITLPNGAKPGDYRKASLAPSIEWFDRHLSSRTPALQVQPVKIYVMGENQWRDEQEWPLARTRYTNFYLHSAGKANGSSGDGLLSLDMPLYSENPDAYIYDPRNPVPSRGGAMLGPRAGIKLQNEIETRKDVLVYSTLPLKKDLEITGTVQLVLHVATSAPNTDFTAKLVNVYPDGKAYNISDGILRRHYLTTNESTNRSTEISIDLWPTSILFREGHRIRLEVSSSNYPRYDRNPNTGSPIATETHSIVATQTIFHDPTTPSRLILPIIPR